MNERLNEAAYNGEKGGVQLRRYIIEENGTISRKRGSLPVPIIFDSICVYTYAYILYWNGSFSSYTSYVSSSASNFGEDRGDK